MFINLLGILGAICFAVCAIPQALKCYKEGNATGISKIYLWLCILGEILTLLYVVLTVCDILLILNYVSNLVFLLIVAKYKYFPIDCPIVIYFIFNFVNLFCKIFTI